MSSRGNQWLRHPSGAKVEHRRCSFPYDPFLFLFIFPFLLFFFLIRVYKKISKYFCIYNYCILCSHMSSLSFPGDSTSFISIASSNDTKMGTGDFTIEWYQYQTDSNTFPRIFQIGNYPTTSIGASIELGSFYFWTAGSFRGGVSIGSYKNSWVHFAIVRSSGTTSVYKNGTLLFAGFSDSTNLINQNIFV
jgi:hypothetical protein